MMAEAVLAAAAVNCPTGEDQMPDGRESNGLRPISSHVQLLLDAVPRIHYYSYFFPQWW